MISIFARDVRLAFRMIHRSPGFAATAILTLAVSTGATAAIAAVAYGVLLKPLPFAAPDRLVAVWPERFQSQLDLRYIRAHAHGLARVSAVALGWTFSLTGAGEPVRIDIDRVSADLFQTLGTPALTGRTLLDGEDAPGAPAHLVLSYRFWRERFGGDRAVVGRTVRLDGEPHEIVGVMPPSFEIFRPRTDGWVALPADATAWYDKLNFSLLVGRLAPAATLEQADGTFRDMTASMRQDLHYPATFGRTARLADLREATTGSMRPSLLLLAASVGFILLIAGANLGTLMVGRTASRAREFAVRAAVGASRATVIRLQLVEALLLAAIGAGAGLALAWATLPALLALLPIDTPRAGGIAVDAAVVAAVFAAAFVVALIAGFAPALAAGRASLAAPLREGAATDSRAAQHVRGAMVAAQIALALVLTIGAGLMLQTLWRLHAVDAGIDVDRILTLRVQPSSERYKDPSAARIYYHALLDRVGALPGVSAAGAIQHLPFSGTGWVDGYEIEGQPIPAGAARPTAGWKVITGNYFAAVGQPLLTGRAFTAADELSGEPLVIINSALARRAFGSAAAAQGRRLRMGREGGAWRTIIGIAGDVRTEALDKPPEPELYTPLEGSTVPALMIAVRAAADPLAIAPAVREAVWAIDRDVPVADLQSMRSLVGVTLARPRLLMTLLGAFAVTGLLLAAIGVYGVVAFGVARRRREIGIRMALGAARASVVTLMLRESVGYSAAGLAAGLGLSLASARLMRGLLFGVTATNPATYATLAIAVTVLVLGAAYLPASRAARLNPTEALRAER